MTKVTNVISSYLGTFQLLCRVRWQRKYGVAAIRLNEEAARDVLLVRAVESEDRTAAVLTRDDRQYATTTALNLAKLGEAADQRQMAAFLALRAGLALDRLVARYPTLQRARTLARWPRWLNWALPLAALIIGLATNAIEGDRLNILAFPLLGMLAWNLAVYAWLLFSFLRRRVSDRGRRTATSPLISLMLRPASAHLAGHPTLERAVMSFGREWAGVAAPLTRARANRTLHLSAATFALGIIAGMFARARYTAEYTAGWAGTWAGAEAEIAALLSVVLGPASAVTGKALPTVERLRELRGAGENAGDWLILWMVAAAIFVIVPRLVLALGSLLRSEQLRRRLAIPHDFYARRLLRDALGQSRTVRVAPYSFELTEQAKETLKRLLEQALGEKTVVQLNPTVPYGEEDQWIGRQGDDLAKADQLIVLFNLASTPEAENHGEFVEQLRQRLEQQAELMVLLDDSAFTHKLRGQASAPRRVEERLHAWKAVLAPSQLEPIQISLDAAPDTAAAQALEAALLRSTSMK